LCGATPSLSRFNSCNESQDIYSHHVPKLHRIDYDPPSAQKRHVHILLLVTSSTYTALYLLMTNFGGSGKTGLFGFCRFREGSRGAKT
jgi:hypothetical protein